MKKKSEWNNEWDVSVVLEENHCYDVEMVEKIVEMII